MILVDSSAWIEYYKPLGDKKIKQAVYTAIQNDEVAINGIIIVEIAGFAKQEEKELILSDFSAFHFLPLQEEVFLLAVTVCSVLRNVGITIPATDAIIASCAMKSEANLIHKDRHFENISQHFPLKIIEYNNLP